MAATVLTPQNDDKPESKKSQKPAFDAIAAIRSAYPTLEKGTSWEIKPVGSDTYRMNLRKETPTQLGGLSMRPIVLSRFVECVLGDDGKPLIKERAQQ